VVGKFSQPVTLHSQDDLPDERDTRSAFPSHLSKVDFGAFARECVEKNSAGFLARVIREACLRVQGNLETVVEFLLRLRRPGLSRVDHWLRPQPARMAPFIAGTDTLKPSYAKSPLGLPRAVRRTLPAESVRSEAAHQNRALLRSVTASANSRRPSSMSSSSPLGL
jgi:hypothetical protein